MRILNLKYDATCRHCGALLPAGTSAAYYRPGMIFGRDCHEKGDPGISTAHYKALVQARKADAEKATAQAQGFAQVETGSATLPAREPDEVLPPRETGGGPINKGATRVVKALLAPLKSKMQTPEGQALVAQVEAASPPAQDPPHAFEQLNDPRPALECRQGPATAQDPGKADFIF